MRQYYHSHSSKALLINILICTITTQFLVDSESTQSPFACDSSNPSTKSYPFCKKTLPITKRAQDLVSRLTLDEKISQLVNTAAAIPRLGIPAYEWWSEALHGVASVGGGEVPQGIQFNGTIRSATSFPQVIVSASTFDAQLWFSIGQERCIHRSLNIERSGSSKRGPRRPHDDRLSRPVPIWDWRESFSKAKIHPLFLASSN